jgi:hypothetical protein
MKRLNFIFFLFFSLIGSAQSARFDIRTYESGSPLGFDIEKLDNGYVITGTEEQGSIKYCWVSRVDSGLNTIWKKRFQLSGNTFQVNPMTITLAILQNKDILLVAKSYIQSQNTSFTEVVSLNEFGNFNWGKTWSDPVSYCCYFTYDLNPVVQLPSGEIRISHSVDHGNMQVNLDPSGNVLLSKYVFRTTPSDTNYAVSNTPCQDGGFLQIHRRTFQNTRLVKLNSNYQIEWTRELALPNKNFWMVNAFENPDGSFWLFGSLSFAQNSDFLNDAYGVVKISGSGQLLEASAFPGFGINYGFAEIFSTGNNTFIFNSTEAEIGTLDLNTGIAQLQRLDVLQANHGFQNLHCFADGTWSMTGMGANWTESKIHFFPQIEDHACLQGEYESISRDSIPISLFTIDTPAFSVIDYGPGTAFNPVMEESIISFVLECGLLGLPETADEKHLQLYPNPAATNSELTLEIESGAFQKSLEVEIVNLQGKTVLQKQFPKSSENYRLTLQDIRSGIYLLRYHLDGAERFRSEKLIIR